jgi:hypothetical protein
MTWVKGRRFSTRQSHVRCAHGQVEVPLKVWLLFQNVIAGPL